jgi:acetone carboxylase gamma subunit
MDSAHDKIITALSCTECYYKIDMEYIRWLNRKTWICPYCETEHNINKLVAICTNQ